MKNFQFHQTDNLEPQTSHCCEEPPLEPIMTKSSTIVVRLSRQFSVTTDTSLIQIAQRYKLKSLECLLSGYKINDCPRLIKTHSPARISQLEKKAARSKLKPLNSLNQYWTLNICHCQEKGDELIKTLNSLGEIELAYLKRAVGNPLVDPSDDIFSINQNYLDPSPVGIDARWAWTQQGAQGNNILLIDVEDAWEIDYADLRKGQTSKVRLVFGENKADTIIPSTTVTYSGDHGSAVLGIIGAEDNTEGIVGIAPSIEQMGISSYFDSSDITNPKVAEAILGALDNGINQIMSAGDILLLEVQVLPEKLPVEVEDHNFDAIRLVSALGIIVIEAAGNGGHNLDEFFVSTPNYQANVSRSFRNAASEPIRELGSYTLRRGAPGFKESGAIMVGACHSELTEDNLHDRIAFSNYGSRLDCYAWGEHVVTLGYGDLANLNFFFDDNNGEPPQESSEEKYTQCFDGTSAAAAIIAGAAVVVQGKYQFETGTRLSPFLMRSILSNPTNGTAQGAGLEGNIGVMPDLRQIITNSLGLAPDVYIRDNIEDNGSLPTPFEGIGISPDIIVTLEPVADPNQSFGQGSGTENLKSLAQIEDGQDNYIYVRMKNRGTGVAQGVTAQIYWSDPFSYYNPQNWNLIGTTSPIDVPSGDILVVTEPLIFSVQDSGLTRKNSTLMVMLDQPDNPAPLLPESFEYMWFFYDFVQNNNNVTWHSLRLVDNIIGPGSTNELPDFYITGAPNQMHSFDFQIIRQLPSNIKLSWEVPISLAFKMGDINWWPTTFDKNKGLARILLPSMPKIQISNVCLSAREIHKTKFFVESRKKLKASGYKIIFKQFFKTREVGQLNWEIVSDRFHYKR